MRLYNQLDRCSLPAADRVITVCQPFADSLARTGVERARIRVLPNSIDPDRRASEQEAHALRRKLDIADNERVILSIGRFSREKGQIDLIRAADHLAQLHPGLRFRLVLAGEGPERERVERAAAELSGRAVFVGHQRDLRPYYSLADLFVLPSYSEGSPNVILEAMAAGVPIVATTVGGVPETVQDQRTALLVPAGNPRALAGAIGRLLTDKPLAARLAANAVADVKERFSPETYRRSLVGIYQECIKGR
jgi:glycosyltransferase involved in cell wall biosynthesis